MLEGAIQNTEFNSLSEEKKKELKKTFLKVLKKRNYEQLRK
ncbi:hypothetical protein AALA90_14615 [Lachnospiraceae bacterium 38-10]